MTLRTVGLTGGIGSGKSTVRQFLSEFGYPCLDADTLARDILNSGAIRDFLTIEFGKEAIDEVGRAKRDVIRKIAFSNPEKKAKLESVMHPLIERAFLDKVSALKSLNLDSWLFYEASLLLETGRYKNLMLMCVLLPR